MITDEHVRDLLRPQVDEPTLIVLQGRALVIPAAELGSDRYRGAVEVISGADLTRQTGTREPSEHDITTLASTLDATVAELGA